MLTAILRAIDDGRLDEARDLLAEVRLELLELSERKVYAADTLTELQRRLRELVDG